jgi:glutamate-ammonia-ligase adenylyltransferase
VLSPDRIGEAGAAFVLRETGEESLAALETRLSELCAEAAQVIEAALAGAGERTDGER